MLSSDENFSGDSLSSVTLGILTGGSLLFFFLLVVGYSFSYMMGESSFLGFLLFARLSF